MARRIKREPKIKKLIRILSLPLLLIGKVMFINSENNLHSLTANSLIIEWVLIPDIM